ncbi:MAG: hypothetical protein UV80_C0007G0069 [Candidatus Peregrinibacteria bacterium GW2011_GWF2_43_17]|nr:MAG: hypothetical protein UV80_C0007G0069 [Candidatus Peregrinibacteria bacterium GW2011_GWF2_43_17]KKT19203.1 MAG: hypothetical protein UW03_C0022G0019 [Candidatus Peregrinibacteria bacterium GW2011_GWA2_43_8]HAU39611.1 hypothetical protein [Candidatus Peregrinibacteria bacterium]
MHNGPGKPGDGDELESDADRSARIRRETIQYLRDSQATGNDEPAAAGSTQAGRVDNFVTTGMRIGDFDFTVPHELVEEDAGSGVSDDLGQSDDEVVPGPEKAEPVADEGFLVDAEAAERRRFIVTNAPDEEDDDDCWWDGPTAEKILDVAPLFFSSSCRIEPTDEQLAARRDSDRRFGVELGGGYIRQKIELDKFAADGNIVMAAHIGMWLETIFKKYAIAHVLNDALIELIYSEAYKGNSIAAYLDDKSTNIWDLERVDVDHPDEDDELPKDEITGERDKAGRRLTAVAREVDLNFIREKLRDAHTAFFRAIPELKILDACTAVGGFSVLVALPIYAKYGLLSGGEGGKGRVRIWLNDVSRAVLDKTFNNEFDIPDGEFLTEVFGSREKFEEFKKYLLEHSTAVCCAVDDVLPFEADFFDVTTIGFGFHHLPEIYAKTLAARNLLGVLRGGGCYAVADEDQVYKHGMTELHEMHDQSRLTKEWPVDMATSQRLVPIEEKLPPAPDAGASRSDGKKLRIVREGFVPHSRSHYNYFGVAKPEGSERGLSSVMANFFFDKDVTEE